MCNNFQEPELIIVSNPNIDGQALIEASRANIPVIAFCNTDTSLKFIDIAIPGNNTNRHSVALLWWMLTREVLQCKGLIEHFSDWDVPVSFFF